MNKENRVKRNMMLNLKRYCDTLILYSHHSYTLVYLLNLARWRHSWSPVFLSALRTVFSAFLTPFPSPIMAHFSRDVLLNMGDSFLLYFPSLVTNLQSFSEILVFCFFFDGVARWRRRGWRKHGAGVVKLRQRARHTGFPVERVFTFTKVGELMCQYWRSHAVLTWSPCPQTILLSSSVLLSVYIWPQACVTEMLQHLAEQVTDVEKKNIQTSEFRSLQNL